MKKNLKAFTLVELVVVMTILTIILGAAMNLIKPINQLFNSTKYADDTNDICSGVMLYMENNLRYATQLTVLSNYPGVPQVENRQVGSSAENQTKYTGVIIIDSNTDNIRGSYASGYVANSTSSERKGAYGQILNIKFNEDTTDSSKSVTTINLNSAEGAYDDAYYGDYGHDFTVSIDVNDNNYYLTTEMITYLPELKNGKYVYETSVFDHTRSFELKNISLASSNCQVKDPDKTYNGSACTLCGKSESDHESVTDHKYCCVDLTAYPQASAPADATDAQREYYSTDKQYTYIFYSTADVKISNKKPVIYDRNMNKVLTLSSAKIGEYITEDMYQTAVNAVESSYEGTNTLDDGTIQSGTFVLSGFKEISGSGGTLNDYKTTAVTGGLEFMAVYSFEAKAQDNPTNNVYFLSPYDSTGNTVSPFGGGNGYIVASPYISKALDLETGAHAASYGTITSVTDPAFCPSDKKFMGWYTGTNGTGTKLSGSYSDAKNTTLYSVSATFDPDTDYYYYAYFQDKPRYTVEYKSDDANISVTVDGNVYSTGVITDVLEGTLGSTLRPTEDPTKSGANFKGWYTEPNGGGISIDDENCKITANTVFYAYFESENIFLLNTPVLTQCGWNNLAKAEIKVKNGYADTLYSFTITFEVPSEITGVNSCDWDWEASISGNVVTMKYKNLGDWHQFTSGEEKTVNVQLYGASVDNSGYTGTISNITISK